MTKNLIHKTIVLKSGSMIRLSADRYSYGVNGFVIYQYIVDMLFRDNRWKRIWVSNVFVHHQILEFLIAFSREIIEAERFQNITLAREARHKYGLEYKVKSSEC